MITYDKLLTKLTQNSLKLLFLAVLAGFITTAQAELYKWVDKDGNVNYTQSPPPAGIQASTIKPPPAVNTDPARDQLESRLGSLDKMAEQRQKQAEQLAKTEQEKQDQQRRCTQARARLASYERPRVSVPGADGAPRQLGEDERLGELAKSRGLIQEFCN